MKERTVQRGGQMTPDLPPLCSVRAILQRFEHAVKMQLPTALSVRCSNSVPWLAAGDS